jgi:hypothetical protein
MELKEILEEIEKRRSRWEKLAFIQMVMSEEKDVEILKALAKIKSELGEDHPFQEPVRIPEAPEMAINDEQGVSELESLIEGPAEKPSQEFKLYTPIEPEYNPLSPDKGTIREDGEMVMAEEWKPSEMPEMRRQFVEFQDWELGRKMFNNEQVEGLIKTPSKEEKEEMYKRKVGHE